MSVNNAKTPSHNFLDVLTILIMQRHILWKSLSGDTSLVIWLHLSQCHNLFYIN